MDKYRRVASRKEAVPSADDEIRITAQGKVPAYVDDAARVLTTMGKTQVVINASGTALAKAVSLAETIKRRFKGLHQVTSLKNAEIVEEYEPLEEGLDRVTVRRLVPCMVITLSKVLLDTSDRGYQAPVDTGLPADLDPSSQGNGGGTGRGRRSRGRANDGDGWGRGKASAKNGPPIGMGIAGAGITKGMVKGSGKAEKRPPIGMGEFVQEKDGKGKRAIKEHGDASGKATGVGKVGGQGKSKGITRPPIGMGESTIASGKHKGRSVGGKASSSGEEQQPKGKGHIGAAHGKVYAGIDSKSSGKDKGKDKAKGKGTGISKGLMCSKNLGKGALLRPTRCK